MTTALKMLAAEKNATQTYAVAKKLCDKLNVALWGLCGSVPGVKQSPKEWCATMTHNNTCTASDAARTPPAERRLWPVPCLQGREPRPLEPVAARAPPRHPDLCQGPRECSGSCHVTASCQRVRAYRLRVPVRCKLCNCLAEGQAGRQDELRAARGEQQLQQWTARGTASAAPPPLRVPPPTFVAPSLAHLQRMLMHNASPAKRLQTEAGSLSTKFNDEVRASLTTGPDKYAAELLLTPATRDAFAVSAGQVRHQQARAVCGEARRSVTCVI